MSHMSRIITIPNAALNPPRDKKERKHSYKELQLCKDDRTNAENHDHSGQEKITSLMLFIISQMQARILH